MEIGSLKFSWQGWEGQGHGGSVNGLGGRHRVTSGVPAAPDDQRHLLPLPSSHPILVEPQEAETKRPEVQGSIPEDRPALGCWAGQRQGPKQNFK